MVDFSLVNEREMMMMLLSLAFSDGEGEGFGLGVKPRKRDDHVVQHRFYGKSGEFMLIFRRSRILLRSMNVC